MALDKEQLQSASAGARFRLNDRLGDIWWSLMLRGLLAVILAIAALFWPQATLSLLFRLVGLYVLLDGALNLVWAFRNGEGGAYLVPGLISLIIGAVLLFWPSMTGKLLLTIVGIWLLFQGGSLLLAARRSYPDDPDRGLLINMGIVITIIGLVLVIWPGTGIVAISWAIAIAALVIGALLIFLALRLHQVEKRFN